MKGYTIVILFLCIILAYSCNRFSSNSQHNELVPADTQRVETLLKEGGQLANSGQYKKAEHKIHDARELADSLNYKNGLQGVYAEKVNLLLLTYKADSAEALLKEGISRFPQGKSMADLYSMLGGAYKFRGENEAAIRAFKTAASLIDSTKYTTKFARIKQNMALTYYGMGSKAKAYEYYQQALRTAEQAQDSTLEALILNNLGFAYATEKDYDNATYYLKRSLTLSEETHFRVNALRVLTNLGIATKDAGKFDEALKYYKKALALSEELQPDNPPFLIYSHLGELYSAKEDFNKAEDYFQKSLNMSRQAGIVPGYYFNSMGLGHLAVLRGRTSEAIIWYSRALQNAKKMHSISFEQDAHEQLYKLYKLQHNNGQALAHLESLKALSDSLNRKNYNQKLAHYRTKLEVNRQDQINKTLEAKQKEQNARLILLWWLVVAGILVILLLIVIAIIQYRSKKMEQQARRLLHEKSNELKRLNGVKDRLFSIVAHDLRNPLSAMEWMLSLWRDGDMDPDDVREAAALSEVSMRHNLNIMENLLAWARQQLSGISVNAEVLDIHDVVERVVQDHTFQAHQKDIAIVNNVQQNLMVYADPDLLNIILRNLIWNAIKFSRKGDRITVCGYKEGSLVTLRVSDDGIGIPAEEQHTIFSTNFNLKSRPGTNNETGSGLGLRLCKEFVELQGGNIRFESEVNEGTTFTFTLPAEEV